MRPERVRRVRLMARHWPLLSAAVLLQITIACGLQVMPLPRVRRIGCKLRPLIRAIFRGDDALAAWAIEATGRRLGRMSTCLVRALAGEMRLGSSRHRVCLVIGVKRGDDGRLMSHAWLHDADRVIIGGPVDDALLPLIQWESAA